MNALVDTGLLLDYLRGDPRAARALGHCTHRSITVLTWTAVMRACPPDRREATRAFLRSFERLSVSEPVADEAVRLSFARPGLDTERAINRASAMLNQLVFVTTDASGRQPDDRDVILAYDGRSAPS